ncbi:hypothetical protein Salat_0378000 [Sesamum alatum]|uniref:Uncharacterized protein n=1 Tax=Sesamum alatum TaxID=300844 RepID=A0AAE1Z302_9LAMI|nr:hypothetical protein Salat_0378000 [Sesamum alatum]
MCYLDLDYINLNSNAPLLAADHHRPAADASSSSLLLYRGCLALPAPSGFCVNLISHFEHSRPRISCELAQTFGPNRTVKNASKQVSEVLLLQRHFVFQSTTMAFCGVG